MRNKQFKRLTPVVTHKNKINNDDSDDDDKATFLLICAILNILILSDLLARYKVINKIIYMYFIYLIKEKKNVVPKKISFSCKRFNKFVKVYQKFSN